MINVFLMLWTMTDYMKTTQRENSSRFSICIYVNCIRVARSNFTKWMIRFQNNLRPWQKMLSNTNL